MKPTKLVNGTPVELTADEISEVVAQAAEYEANRVPNWRNTASTSRRAFCVAAFRAGFLLEADAVAAAKGEWPAAFDDALAGQPADVVAEAKIEWGAVSTIYRNAPLLEVVRLSKGYTPEQVDALFQ